MKKLFTVLVLSLFVGFISFAQDSRPAKGTKEKTTIEKTEVQPVSGAKMTFEYLEVDYGNLTQGANGVRKFPFINDGTEPLIITSAKGSCGCTVPRYPREPILPGEKAEIEVRYDTKRIGKFTKTVRLVTNVNEKPVTLTIKGEIAKEPEGVPVKPKGLITPQG